MNSETVCRGNSAIGRLEVGWPHPCVPNGTTFEVTDGFPSTGFIGVEFTLEVAGVAADYT